MRGGGLILGGHHSEDNIRSYLEVHPFMKKSALS